MTGFVNIQAQSNANLNIKTRTKYQKSGETVDFTGYTALMQIRERKDGYVVLATLSSEAGEYDGTILLGDDGIITLNLDTLVLREKVRSGNWYYDVVLTRPDGVQVRWMEGQFNVDSSTTIELD
jgi:hypothetical protein